MQLNTKILHQILLVLIDLIQLGAYHFHLSVSNNLENQWPLAQLSRARSRCGRSGVRFPDRSNRHSVANGSPRLRRFFGAV